MRQFSKTFGLGTLRASTWVPPVRDGEKERRDEDPVATVPADPVVTARGDKEVVKSGKKNPGTRRAIIVPEALINLMDRVVVLVSTLGELLPHLPSLHRDHGLVRDTAPCFSTLCIPVFHMLPRTVVLGVLFLPCLPGPCLL